MLFYAGVQLTTMGLRAAAVKLAKNRTSGSQREDQEFYKSERLPVFAPPGVAFPIAWGINSISAIAGGLHVLNLPEGTAGRETYLRLQGVAWVLFSTFDAAYFGLRSPINAALVTYAYTAVTVASLDVAVRRLHDPAAAWFLAPTAVWLALANPVGTAQAAWNHDPFWNVGPVVEPKPEWVKPAAV